MELDEMRTLWAEHDVKIEKALRLNRRLITGMELNRAKSSMQRLIVGLILEAGIQLIAVIALGSFVCAHWRDARFAIPGVVVDLFAIAILSGLIRQIALASRIDYSAAVVHIQRQIEELRILRIRTVQGILVISPLLWTPLLIVCLKGFFGFDAYQRLSVPWLAANVLFGIAFLAGALWIAHRYADRLGRLPFVQRLAEDLAGHSLNSAARFAAAIDELAGTAG